MSRTRLQQCRKVLLSLNKKFQREVHVLKQAPQGKTVKSRLNSTPSVKESAQSAKKAQADAGPYGTLFLLYVE